MRNVSGRCSQRSAGTELDSWVPTASESRPRRSGSTRHSHPAQPHPATSGSPRRAARSGSRCSKRPSRGVLDCPHSSRSGTKRTSRRTTCSSGGRTTRRRRSSCSISSPSATRGASGRSRAASRARSRSSRSRVERRGRRTGGELAHGGARRLRGSGRRPLPSGGSDPRELSGGAHRRGDPALDAADAAWATGGRPDERRRSRDPVCGCVRGGRTGPAATHGGDRSSDRTTASERSEPRQSRGHARLCNRRVVRERPADRPRRPRRRRRDRALRACRERHGRGRRRCDSARDCSSDR